MKEKYKDIEETMGDDKNQEINISKFQKRHSFLCIFKKIFNHFGCINYTNNVYKYSNN